MKDVTRREFLHTMAGAAVGGTIGGHDIFVHGETVANPATTSSHDGHEESQPLQSLIFPRPQEISSSGSNFLIDDQVSIVVPSEASEQDLLLATSLVNEMNDRFGLRLQIERLTNVSANRRVIVMGSVHNPLVRHYCAEMKLAIGPQNFRPEGYILRITKNFVLIAGADDRGAFYGFQSLRQLLTSEEKMPQVAGVQIRDWPDKPFRGIYMYLPGRDNIAFFKRFVRDFMALHKYNTLILEMNACMRIESHQELNYGLIQFSRYTNSS